jgi:hypothetical protein
VVRANSSPDREIKGDIGVKPGMVHAMHERWPLRASSGMNAMACRTAPVKCQPARLSNGRQLGDANLGASPLLPAHCKPPGTESERHKDNTRSERPG